MESHLDAQNDKLQRQELRNRELENERRLAKELKAAKNKHMEHLEAQVRQLETTIKTCQSSRDALQSQLDTLRKEVDAEDASIRDRTAQATGDAEKLRDGARTELEHYRKLADSRKTSSDNWMTLCQERDRALLRFEKEVADLLQELKAARNQEANLERARDNSSDELRNAQETIQAQSQSIDSLQQSACTMAKLVMAQCPPGLEWPRIMERIDWNCEVVVALPTHSPWKVQKTWSKDPMLAVDERTESLTSLLLLIVASVEARSLAGIVSYLSAIQMRLNEESECIVSVVKLFLDAVSVCIELEGAHAFQIFLLLQVTERIGRAWPVVQDTVDQVTHRGRSHELASSISRSVVLWGQGQRLGSLDCETSIQYQDWTLVGFFRKPNGILLLGDSELRWADHDFFEIITKGVTVGEGNDEIEFEVEGQDWNWWVEHIL
ncbi:hypothetical protein FPHYL_3979 [Fusarium phyllophilum]|uniref:Uncharacterized protein n=1 Tax=Fusarium phyllophilum TaxID=47803 RepID=A0A8H5K4T1_9HYPO|nr:hypothetical protein FPHYL_3979 [Fusarium phyllophilum]